MRSTSSVASDIYPVPTIHVGSGMRELMRALTLRFFKFIHTRRHPYVIRIRDKLLTVQPTVFTPRYLNLISLKASELLAENLQVPIQGRVLDLGTGTGIQGIFAASRASEVIATDLNPAAVKCARENGRANGVKNMQVRLGDLFEPVRSEKFDLITFLPPSFFVEPANMAEIGFMCGEKGQLLRRFCDEVGSHLTPAGKIQFSCVDRTRQFIVPLLQRNGFRCERIVHLRRLPMETVSQYLAWR